MSSLCIPHFFSTEQSEAFGREATSEQIDVMRREAARAEACFETALRRNSLDRAMRFAVRVQLLHESIAAADPSLHSSTTPTLHHSTTS